MNRVEIEESDDSSFLESVTKEVEQLKPYLYEPLCSTIVSRKNYFLLTMVLRIRKVVINNEGNNIEVDVVAGPSRVAVLNWCKNCKEESREIDCCVLCVARKMMP